MLPVKPDVDNDMNDVRTVGDGGTAKLELTIIAIYGNCPEVVLEDIQ